MSYSVFSTHLIQNYCLTQEVKLKRELLQDERFAACSQVNQQQLYKDLCKKGYDPYLLLDIPEVIGHFDRMYDETLYNKCSYLMCTVPELRTVVSWTIKNIIAGFEKDTVDTTYVKIRIATDMLNRICEKKYISKGENIYFHEHLIEHVLDYKNDYTVFSLPF